ncbi:MAG TPA: malto-oligosyltrehalose synthase [Solirubrobacteraceae bacterium]|nr:malto-oligosyltrehalose synthase [Solirubrobacteraceae bacterium]
MSDALIATYRLQLGPDLGFDEVRGLVPYLQRLGVSHLYLSPVLQARAGSTHGYDVVDPTRISEELGGESAFRRLAAAGMPIILDIVPNHMGTGEQNRWWSDPQLRERWFDLDPAGGYRRFFDIDDMAAIRQERDEVFETSHRKVLELYAEGLVSGLRVDHPDGLADPAGYLRRLADAGVERLWVEKILHPGEPLREWPVSGTVGYEFLNDACALFVDPAAREPLTELLASVTGERRTFSEVALEAQLEQARVTFRAEVARLERLGPFDAAALAHALAALPVYRTYVEPHSGLVEEADRRAVHAAEIDPALARTLLLEEPAQDPELITRFQQTSPAIAAKGVEDTAFYRYLRLLALNEVGGDPERFGLSIEEFHAANAERAARFPQGLLVTQTHDTKRSGDSRARIAALSELPGEWAEHVTRWLAIGEQLDAAMPPAVQYLVHQSLIGVWPVAAARLEAYLRKALRETKQQSSWADPDEGFEAAAVGFARALVESEEFLADFTPFAERVARIGERGALGALLLKLTCPGVPDIYQGDELWRLSFVDPDNRRAVDWDRRRATLRALLAEEGVRRATLKMNMIVRALALRRRLPDCFEGAYEPLDAGEGVCAFRRGEKVMAFVAVRPRAPARLREAPPGTWRDVLTGATVEPQREPELDQLLADSGAALLARE